MDPLLHIPAGDFFYMRKWVNDSSLWNFTLDNWFHNGTTDGFLPLGIKVTIVVVYSIVCIVGLVGNCSVMYVIIRKDVQGGYLRMLAYMEQLCEHQTAFIRHSAASEADTSDWKKVQTGIHKAAGFRSYCRTSAKKQDGWIDESAPKFHEHKC